MATPHRLSLNGLRAFEATARLRSFSAAAEELSVTHGAVSRHIRTLEDSLGLALLQRTAQGATPTNEGLRLAEGLSTAFGLIQSSVEQLKPGPLTLACSESIMMYWLIPRLNRFKEINPEVELRFNMSHGPIDFAHDKVSVAIRLSSIDPPKEAVRADVAHEWIGPVCSPGYLQNHRIESFEDLARARLMISLTRPTAWADWASCSGQMSPELRVDESFAHFYLLIQGARCGLGMANVPHMLVRDDLMSGTLVAPMGFVCGPNRLAIWTAPHLSRRPDVVKLVDWLHDELRASEP
ncbi:MULTISPECIES: LysR substrate-binding domain-containing protein [Delftia]|jgi:DNA-binding transcriptional LysR family regulator|uniref:LysR substrate-binding domain-containing protein n=1 Tax=Delftia TaxID=80865 RepID=UPI0009684E9A|nr:MULTISPECIES: LysR substrate-binding domain-containing protein [Delftia]MCP4017844.1 LysR family transcriptional regulator [Delftia sp.]MBO0986011.1 LysR family transcriptional regulator [Delftia sp. SD083]MBO1032703.1 LysR family transcriptional regulator [Delftia sp. SD018]MCP4517492.1 LysR family transcriptional regulator [Delftia sp.]MCP4532267.1 LysR family transcriptional regulator [Delftia sp.]